MPNLIKYSTGSTPAGCLRKGNMLIGNNTADYGSTFFNGINPPTGGYTIYLNKASQGPSIYCPENDAKLIERTNQIAGASYTTAAQCLDYFAGQTDKIVVNSNYDGIVTSGLILNLDASFLPSYPTTGTTWYDVSGNSNNGTLTNGPTFNSGNGGNIIFDGSNDYADVSLPSGLTVLTVEAFIKWNSFNAGMFLGFNTYDIWTQSNTLGYNNGASNVVGINAATVTSLGLLGNWKHYTFTINNSGLLSTNKIHINGVQQSMSAVVGADGNIPGIGLTLRLANWINGGYSGNVTYGYARGYNRALSDAEILQNYNATKARFGL